MSKARVPEDNSSAIILTDRHGGISYVNEFWQLHREGDLPAVINHEGSLYYKNGDLHRDGGSASISSGQESYYRYGQRHREDGPATTNFFTSEDGNRSIFCQEYFQNNVCHRDNGPAIMWDNGSYQHYKNGVLHNDKGPACHWVKSEGTEDEYYLNGKKVSKTVHKISTLRDNLFSNNKTSLKNN